MLPNEPQPSEGEMRLEDVLGVLNTVIIKNHEAALGAFLARENASQWVIASDYVIGGAGRYRDAYCYTIYPIYGELETTLNSVRASLPRDLKKTVTISTEAVKFLRSARHFSFCFVLRQGQTLFGSIGAVRDSLDLTIEMVEARSGWAEQLAALKRLRQKARAKNFNVKLLSDGVLASLFAAVIAMFVTKLASAALVSWFSDRDSMVISYNKIAFDLLGMHFYQACHEFQVPYGTVKLAVGDMSAAAWYDEMVRIPDFLAGALSAFDRETRGVATEKHLDLLTKVVSDAANIAVIEVDVTQSSFGARSLLLFREGSVRNGPGCSAEYATGEGSVR